MKYNLDVIPYVNTFKKDNNKFNDNLYIKIVGIIYK